MLFNDMSFNLTKCTIFMDDNKPLCYVNINMLILTYLTLTPYFFVLAYCQTVNIFGDYISPCSLPFSLFVTLCTWKI